MALQQVQQPSLVTHVPVEQLECLSDQAVELRLDAGDVLFQEGDAAKGLYVVLEGEIEISKRVGGQEVVLASMHPGAFVGEISLLTGLPHTATGMITMPTRLLKFEAELFDSIKASPIAELLLSTMARRLRDTEALVQQHEKLSALGKMAAGLAHELNNPAAANLRASNELPETISALQSNILQLYHLSLSVEQLDFLNDLQQQLMIRSTLTCPLDPMALSDLEEEITVWLDEQNVPDGWKLAPMFANALVDVEQLKAIQERIGPDALVGTLKWLEGVLTVGGISHTLTDSATRISDLIKAVKAYTYMDQSPLQEIDIHDGLENTLTVLGPRLSRIVVNREFDKRIPRISALGSEINQVWTILIDNAIDAMQSCGELRLRTTLENDHVIVEIGDDGTGIPDDIQSRIFEPFFTTKAVGEGTGLGLNIARRIIVERHSGNIRVVSSPGDTIFRVSLPLVNQLR